MMLEHARRARGIATMADVRKVIGSVYVDRLLRLDHNPEGYARARAAGWWDANELDLCAAYTLLAVTLQRHRARKEAGDRAHRIVDMLARNPGSELRMCHVAKRAVKLYRAAARRIRLVDKDLG